jgi:hypothetical protein
VPLSADDALDLVRVTGAPSAAQRDAYAGRTSAERYGRWVEASAVGLLGVLFSYFLSFVVGPFPAAVSGAACLFWGLFASDLKAAQRNWEFTGGRPLVSGRPNGEGGGGGLYGALYAGRIAAVSVVEDAQDDVEYDLEEFRDYTMETDELDRWTGQPYLLRVRVTDREDRAVQVHCRLSEEYLDVRVGMSALCVLLSTDPRFAELAAVTDLHVPDAECWLGDYPYLDRAAVEEFLVDNPDVWDMVRAEADGGAAHYSDRHDLEDEPYREEDETYYS